VKSVFNSVATHSGGRRATKDMSVERKKKERASWNRFLSQSEIFIRESSKPYSYGVLWTYIYRKNFEAILRLVGDVKDRTVLDVGCGGGWLCEWLAFEGANVVGVDISFEFCRALKMRARKRGFDAHIICADGECLPFKENSFYASVIYQALHHLPNPEKAISEALRTSEGFVLGDEPAKLLFPHLFVKLLKMLALSRVDVEELSGIKGTRFDPLGLSKTYQKKGYLVRFERQWSMVPTILSKAEKFKIIRRIYEIAYLFLMGIEAIRNMGHGFTMIIKKSNVAGSHLVKGRKRATSN